MHLSTYIAAALVATASLVVAAPQAPDFTVHYVPLYMPLIASEAPPNKEKSILLHDNAKRFLTLFKDSEEFIYARFSVESEEAARKNPQCTWVRDPVKDNIYLLRSGDKKYCAINSPNILRFVACDKEDKRQHWQMRFASVSDAAGKASHDGVQIQPAETASSTKCLTSELAGNQPWYATTSKCHLGIKSQFFMMLDA